MSIIRYKVSVIVPIYKVELYIMKCANSLFSQSLDSIEYIFVDDCSPDNSITLLKSVLEKYPIRIKDTKFLHHSKNRGLAAARNTGILSVSGEYIIFCDSDDWIDENMYEIMYNTAVKENSDIVVCDYVSEYSKRKICYSQSFSEKPNEFLEALLSGKLHNGLWNKLIKKDLYDCLDFFWTEGINMWEDVSIVPRVAFYAKKIDHIPQAFYHYNQMNFNSYTQVWSEASINNVFEVVGIIDSFFKSHSKGLENDIVYFKLSAKNILLQNVPFNCIKRVKDEFSEVNSMVFHQPALSFIHKIKLWCCFRSLTPVAFMIARCINIAKKIIR